jgi:hypothetical protein
MYLIGVCNVGLISRSYWLCGGYGNSERQQHAISLVVERASPSLSSRSSFCAASSLLAALHALNRDHIWDNIFGVPSVRTTSSAQDEHDPLL